MEEFGRLDSGEKTNALLGDKWWPQGAKEEGAKISETFTCTIICGNDAMSAQVLQVSLIRGRNGAPSRKGCVVDGQMTKKSNR